MIEKYLNKLEYNKILDLVSNYCSTYIGKDFVSKLMPLNNKDLVNRINQKQFTFISKEYNFNIHTLYKPETSTSREQTIRTLIDIVEIDLNGDNPLQ